MKVLEEIGKKIGLGVDLSKRLQTGDTAKDVQKALDMTNVYGVYEPHTLIIAGNIMTNSNLFQHNADTLRENIITILKSIL